MIDINNKKFNFYDPIKLIEMEKISEKFFSDIIYILSEKYIPNREKNKIKNQFSNLILNYSNKNSEKANPQKKFSSFENILNEDLIIRLEKKSSEVTLLKSNFILIDINNNKNLNFTEEILNKILEKRMIPIISHPERFEIFEKNNLKRLKSKGVLFQLSLGSFSSYFGETSMIKSKDFLETGIYDFVASDTNNYHQYNDDIFEDQINEISKIVGSSKLNQLLYDNPKNVIDEKTSNDYQLLHTKGS
tara:strand:- start:16184 stop:16924 length:741 start_codon:yes stop_codon:yes gene_type:complete